MKPASTREPAVAGWFYPGDAKTLASTVDQLLGPRATAPEHPVRVLISPHAGYAYSGATAARGFKRLHASHTAPARAFILSPSHVESFGFTSVFDGHAYATPLGEVPVDTEACRAVAREESIRLSTAGHALPRHGRGEHGIEVLLPFLQRVAPGLHIVPMVMGEQSWEACEALARTLGHVVDWERDVIIASSDLSHFHPDARARELDAIFCDTLSTLDAELLHARITRRECEACGAGPVVAALLATTALRHRACQELARSNSGDVSHDRSSVVGYVSAVVTGDSL